MNLTKEQVDHMVNTMSITERKNWVQLDALGFWEHSNSRGSLELATGVGKTRAAILAIERQFGIDPKSIVHIGVPTETLCDVDWVDEFKKWGCEHLLKKVKIFCHTSMNRTKSKTAEVDLFVFDECHHFTLKQEGYFINNKVYKVLGLSATLPDGTRDEKDAEKKAIIDKYCPSIYKVSLEEAIALGLIADFEIKTLKFKLDDTKVFNYGTEQKRQMRTELQQYKQLSKQLGQTMFNKKFEHAKYKFMQKRREHLVNSKSKLALAKLCIEKMLEPGKRTLIFCGSIAQAELLLGTNVYHSRSDDKALIAFQNKETDYLGAVDALNEGKNITELDQILIIQGTSVNRVAVQRAGRALRVRPGHKALIAILVTKDTADEKWYTKAYENFDKSRIKEYLVTIPPI